MTKIKKYLEIYKINRRINELNRELFSSAPSSMSTVHGHFFHSPQFRRPTEKENFMRERINNLVDTREEIRSR